VQLSDEALAAERRLGTTPDAHLWHVRALIAQSMGAFNEQIEYLERAAAVHRARGDTAGLAVALGASAVGRTMLGDTPGAISDADEALACARTIDARGATKTTLSLAAYALAEPDPERALALLNEAIELNTLLGRTPGPMGRCQPHPGEPRQPPRRAAVPGARHRAIAPHRRAASPATAAEACRRPARAGRSRSGGHPPRCCEGGMPSPQSEDDHRRAVEILDGSLGETRRKKLTEQGERTDEDAAISLALDAIRRVADVNNGVDATRPSL
jgi:tetratricopeptide (TPR) repeat protein